MKTKKYWGTQRVARVCQVSPATVAHWIDQGLLKGHKTPTGRRRVEAAELVKFLRTREMTVPADLRDALGRDVVVVVDDDHAYLQALAKTIEKADLGVEVVKASSGVDALLEIGRVRPSLIVLDFSLPDLNAVARASARRRGAGGDGRDSGGRGQALARSRREDEREQGGRDHGRDRGDSAGVEAAEGGVGTSVTFVVGAVV